MTLNLLRGPRAFSRLASARFAVLGLVAIAMVASTAPAQSRSSRRKKTTTRQPTVLPASLRRPAWTAPIGPAALSSAVEDALASHTRSGEWGAMVVSLTRGDTLYAHNPDVMMQPASTMKMYTSAVALDLLGPDFTFRTPALRDADVGPDGTLSGNLYLRGTGDPSLSQRFWHDVPPMDALAHEIASTGIKHIKGDIIGDPSAFDDKLVPDGWKSSYLGASYAARVSALSLNENLIWVVVQPAGNKVQVTTEPATTTTQVNSTVSLTSGSRGKIIATRRPDGSIAVRGTIGRNSPPLKYSLVVDNPPLFTTGALESALRRQGITVDGSAKIGPAPTNATEVAAIQSPPLAQIVGEMDRESINLFAELLFRATAHKALDTVGTAETGLEHLRDFMSKKVGTQPTVVNVSDGSGLSLNDSVTARSMVQLLGYAHKADWGPVFHAALPVEGESGTLKRQGVATPSRGNLHAKTGTTNTVSALGGFVTARNGEVLAFSLIYNGNDRWNAKAAMNEIGATLAEFVRE